MKTIRTIHVDIEGGFGGSSRSLYELVSRLDRERFTPLVLHRQKGPIEERYRKIGIETLHVPEIGSYAPRDKNSFKIFVASLPRLLRLRKAANIIAAAAKGHKADIVHLNYEGLFLLAKLLQKRLDLPFVCHSRTQIPLNRWGQWVVRTLAKTTNQMFFISPAEERNFRKLAGDEPFRGEVLWNIATTPEPRKPFAEVPEIIYLGNVDPEKGTDRLVDVAIALEQRNAPPMKISIWGKPRVYPEFSRSIEERIEQNSVSQRIELCGHTSQPETVMASAFALIRPSRWNDPWGRDVLEATRAGVPVFATGSFDGVVEPERTGYLFDPFDANDIAEKLIALRTDAELWERLSLNAKEKGEKMYSGAHQRARVQALFEELVKRNVVSDSFAE